MSTIPPNLVGPILQAGQASQQASRVLESERDQQFAAAERGNRIKERVTEAVSGADDDTQVDPDAEGGGSLGRQLDHHNEAESDQSRPTEGITEDPEGQIHLDLKA